MGDVPNRSTFFLSCCVPSPSPSLFLLFPSLLFLFSFLFLISFPSAYRVTYPFPRPRIIVVVVRGTARFFGSRRKKWLVNYIIVIVKAGREGCTQCTTPGGSLGVQGRAGMHIIKTFRTVLSLVAAPTHTASTVSMVSGSLELLSSSRAPAVYTLIGGRSG